MGDKVATRVREGHNKVRTSSQLDCDVVMTRLLQDRGMVTRRWTCGGHDATTRLVQGCHKVTTELQQLQNK